MMEKIKKSELKMEIEDLKEEVSNLRETLQYLIDETKKVTIFHHPTWANEPSTVIGKGTIEGEEDKPQFEVGKVYKGERIMFYCTRIKNNEELYGFGFNRIGGWSEESDVNWVGDFTEATPEEWFERLEEEYNRRGFKKGTKYKSTKFFNYELGECKGGKLRLNCNSYGMQTLCESGSPFIMEDGKWAEIIEEQKYQVGTLGAFWDGDYEDALNNLNIYVGYFGGKTDNERFHPINLTCSWENFKPLKFD